MIWRRLFSSQQTLVALNYYFYILYHWWQGSVYSLPNLRISQQLGVRIVLIPRDTCFVTTPFTGAFRFFDIHSSCFVLVINGDRRCKPRGYNPVWTLDLPGADCVAVNVLSLKDCVGTVVLQAGTGAKCSVSCCVVFKVGAVVDGENKLSNWVLLLLLLMWNYCTADKTSDGYRVRVFCSVRF